MFDKPDNSRIISSLLTFFLSLGVFALVFLLHYLFYVFFPEQDQAQVQWILIPEQTSSFQNYIASGGYWFGYTYGICFVFICLALKNYWKNRCGTSRNFVFGGITLTGFWAFCGCFLIGCCGSPMIVVWLNLFGNQFLPFAKPFVALITTVSLITSWFWMKRKKFFGDCTCAQNIDNN